MQVRFSQASYLGDIYTVRRRILANGNRKCIEPIDVSIDQPTVEQIRLYMNLAIKSPSDPSAPTASLYILAFENQYGIWRFGFSRPSPRGTHGTLPLDFSFYNGTMLSDITPKCKKLPVDASYPNPLPKISKQVISNAIQTANKLDISRTRGEYINPAKRQSLMVLVIAVAEAVRFDFVRNGVYTILNPIVISSIYEPNTRADRIKHWQNTIPDDYND